MSYKDLYVNQVESFLQQHDAIVIDIRDIESYMRGHMQGARHVDGPTMGNLIRQRKNNPPILIYCYRGNLSRDIAGMVSGFGFDNVSHLDGGWEAALRFVRQEFEDELEVIDARTLALADPKSTLQEAAQGRGLPLPQYREARASGPDHRPMWAFDVLWDGEEIARGEGASKREAQQRAARRALVRLGLVPDE